MTLIVHNCELVLSKYQAKQLCFLIRLCLSLDAVINPVNEGEER